MGDFLFFKNSVSLIIIDFYTNMKWRRADIIMTDTLERIPGSHLTYEERCQISVLFTSGIPPRGIAETLGVHHKTIYSELSRNQSDGKYHHKKAQEISVLRRREASSRPQKMTPGNISLITELLEDTQPSPQQISGRLRKNGKTNISHESIYRYIWADKLAGGDLYLHLRRKAKKYNKRLGKTAGRGCIPNRVDIDQRHRRGNTGYIFEFIHCFSP